MDQTLALEVRLADGMLHDEPGGLGAILASDILRGPTVLCDQFAQTRGITNVNRFHSWNVWSAELSFSYEFITYAQVFFAHGDEFAA
jgi:hypothetical protein